MPSASVSVYLLHHLTKELPMNDCIIEDSLDVVDQDSLVERGDAAALIVHECDCDCEEEC